MEIGIAWVYKKQKVLIVDDVKIKQNTKTKIFIKKI